MGVMGARADPQARDRGQAAVALVTIASVVFVAITMALVAMGTTLVERSRAQTAADAAALAATSAGSGEARRIAEANGASLVSWVADGDDVIVVVQVGGVMATARATDAP